MPAHKKHHIIPQHYLRGFSIDRDNQDINAGNKRICCHNVNKEKRHCMATKNVGYENNFYGKDEQYGVKDLDKEDEYNCKNLEDVLNRFETQHNDLLKQIIYHGNLYLTNIGLFSFYTFLILLKGRTKSARDFAIKTSKTMGENLGQTCLDKNGRQDLRANATPHPVGTHFDLIKALLTSMWENLHNMIGLNAVLLINDTETNFITSDNPVIFYNYIAPNYSLYKITTALTCSGFIMFCPITEKLLIMLYDEDLYKVHRHIQTTIRVTKESDIDSMNKLQALKCSDEIYYYGEGEIDYIKKLRSSVEKYIKEPQSTITKLDKKYKNPYAIGDDIILQQYIETYYKIRLSFLTFNKENIKVYKRIDEYKTRNNIPSAVFRYEIRNALSGYRKY